MFAKSVCRIERTASLLPAEKAVELCNDCSYVLTRAQPACNNLPMREHAVLTPLGADPNIIITEADKGTAVVVMEVGQYEEKMAKI